jgi:hypothetical protein
MKYSIVEDAICLVLMTLAGISTYIFLAPSF